MPHMNLVYVHVAHIRVSSGSVKQHRNVESQDLELQFSLRGTPVLILSLHRDK